MYWQRVKRTILARFTLFFFTQSLSRTRVITKASIVGEKTTCNFLQWQMMIARLSLLNQGLCLLANAVRGTSASGARYIRIWDVIRTHLGRGTTASAPRHDRTWGSVRYQLRFLCRPLLSLKLVLKISLDCFPLHG